MTNPAYEEEIFELAQQLQDDNPNLTYEDAKRLARRQVHQ
jgi:hypothetical protein